MVVNLNLPPGSGLKQKAAFPPLISFSLQSRAFRLPGRFFFKAVMINSFWLVTQLVLWNSVNI